MIGWNNPRQLDLRRGAVQVKEREEWNGVVNVHENLGRIVVLGHDYFPFWSDRESYYVPFAWGVGNILLHHPILRSVQQTISFIGESYMTDFFGVA